MCLIPASAFSPHCIRPTVQDDHQLTLQFLHHEHTSGNASEIGWVFDVLFKNQEWNKHVTTTTHEWVQNPTI